MFKFGTCIDPNFHFESGHPQVTKEPVLHLENLSNLTLGFLGEPSGKAERTPNPSDSFASKEFIFFGVGDLRFAPIVLTPKSHQKKSRLRPLHSKNLRLMTEILQTPPFGRQTGSISTSSALVFWFTGRGQS